MPVPDAYRMTRNDVVVELGSTSSVPRYLARIVCVPTANDLVSRIVALPFDSLPVPISEPCEVSTTNPLGVKPVDFVVTMAETVRPLAAGFGSSVMLLALTACETRATSGCDAEAVAVSPE